MEHIKSFQAFTEFMNQVQMRKIAEEKAIKQSQYAEFFKSKLEKYGVSSLDELSEEQKEKFFEEISKWKGNKKMNESILNEANVKDKSSFKEYVYTLYKNAFGDKFDEKKADEVINGLIDKYKENWGAMVGAVKASLGK